MSLRERLFQQLLLRLEIYAALGIVDEEIYILRLRSRTGPAGALALAKGLNPISCRTTKITANTCTTARTVCLGGDLKQRLTRSVM